MESARAYPKNIRKLMTKRGSGDAAWELYQHLLHGTGGVEANEDEARNREHMLQHSFEIRAAIQIQRAWRKYQIHLLAEQGREGGGDVFILVRTNDEPVSFRYHWQLTLYTYFEERGASASA